MKKLISFIAAAMCAVTTASAEDLSAYITAGDDTGVISVNGEGAAYGGQLVSILIAKDEGGFYALGINELIITNGKNLFHGRVLE